jgi:hypothetical protein
MSRPLTCLALCLLALAPAACRTSPSMSRREAIEKGALIRREVKGYHVISAAHRGKVGYVKVYDVTEAGGPPYEWKYVYDNDWHELGFVDQFGGATKYHYYSPSEQAQQNQTLRATRLPSDSLERNVLRILDIDPSTDELTFPAARQSDITGDVGTMPLAGPGIVPATAPVK